MTYLVVLCIVLAAATASSPLDRNLDDEWLIFKKTFQKAYTKDEESIRRYVWEENVRYVMEHNVRYDLGIHRFTLGINEYADLTPEEYKKYLLGYRMPDKKSKKKYSKETFKYSGANLPDTVDWRQKGYVTPIKNQGACGSCWAFSSTGSLEGQHFRKTGKLVSLSEQNLIDCTRKYGNGGCHGGWMDNAFRYIRDNKGIDLESDYRYEAKDDTCRYKKSGKGATDIGFTDIETGSESALQEASATQGPISVAIDATHRSFQLYRNGVYDEPKCNASKLDHAVLVVGYGTQDNQDYWLVKNSWGTSWGDNGYIKMSRNKKDQCGIATHASYPKV